MPPFITLSPRPAQDSAILQAGANHGKRIALDRLESRIARLATDLERERMAAIAAYKPGAARVLAHKRAGATAALHLVWEAQRNLEGRQ